jgi:hypothetical protein
MSTSALLAPLTLGIQALGLSLTDAQVQQLLAYQDLLTKWNKVYNLDRQTLAVALDEHFGTYLPDAVIEGWHTVGDVVASVEAHQGREAA